MDWFLYDIGFRNERVKLLIYWNNILKIVFVLLKTFATIFRTDLFNSFIEKQNLKTMCIYIWFGYHICWW